MTRLEAPPNCIEREGDRLIATCGLGLYAVIGAHFRFDERTGELETLFAWRSKAMENFGDIPSLFSERFAEESPYDPRRELPDPNDRDAAQGIFDRFSHNRIGDTPVIVNQYLGSSHLSETSSVNRTNPRRHTVLDFYRIDFPEGLEPKRLNPQKYTGIEWLTREGYTKALGEKACGMCVATFYDLISLLYPGQEPYQPPPDPRTETS